MIFVEEETVGGLGDQRGRQVMMKEEGKPNCVG